MSKKSNSKKRRARGTGSIFHDVRRDVWVGRIPVGRNVDGTTKYVERSDPTQKGLIEKLKLVKPPEPTVTVGEWATRWLSDLGVREGTADTYRHSVANFITPTIGHVRLTELSPHQIESAARKWGSALKPNTVRLTLAHLSVCLNAAVRAGILDRNPVARSRKPPGEKKKIDPFTPAELLRIVEAGEKRRSWRVFALLATVGCRSGEAIALNVPDWQPGTEMISITKTESPRGRGPGPPKSRNSVRTIRVPPEAIATLTECARKRKAGPLYLATMGTRLKYSAVASAFESLLKSLGLRYRNVHQLRHSVATAMIAAGDPIGDVAEYLGDTAETVVKCYLHPTGKDPSRTMSRLFQAAKTQGGDKVGM